MELGLNCFSCKSMFNNIQNVPLVLKCGDSICMNCLIKVCGQGESECSICRHKFLINFSALKDLPVNKALLAFIKQGPKISNFVQAGLDGVNPYLDQRELCKRPGCPNTKYEHLNVVYEYCSINCFELDKTGEKMPTNT